jgi:hypothetical protein
MNHNFYAFLRILSAYLGHGVVIKEERCVNMRANGFEFFNGQINNDMTNAIACFSII